MSRRTAVLAFAAAGCAMPTGPRSYLELPLRADGSPYENPYIVNVERGPRAVKLIGVVHSRDPLSPVFSAIEREFTNFAPDLVVHENQAPPQVADRNRAIATGGDIGFVVYLARTQNVAFMSGDLTEAEEFPILATRAGVEPALVLLTAQRLITGLNGNLDAAASEYEGFYEEYLVANGFPRNEQHSSWQGFADAFARVQGYSLQSREWDHDISSPLRDLGLLNRVSRLSHELRDQRLLDIIRAQAAHYRRILVVFGAWHILAIEPVALDAI